MTTATDLHELPLHELAERIRDRELSPLEVTQALLERIERLQPTLNAYITVMADAALADARAAEDEIGSGRYRGPLHGVPVGVKDLCATKGVRTTAGSTILGDWVPDFDAEVVRRLRGAGAVIIGKTNLHEFAFGATGINPHYGSARNPWDTERITGGSSSGSAAAAAAGLCYAALGSDTGGSVRIPSSLCGIVGLKPTYGRVSLRGVVPLAWSLDHIGPMARSARDCALVLGAIAGHDPEDPGSADAPVEDWAGGIDRGIEGLRVGVPAGYAYDHTEPDVAAAFQSAIETVERLGAEVRHVEVPSLPADWAAAGLVLLGEAGAYHKDNLEQHPDQFSEDVRVRFRDLKATDYILAARRRDEARRTADADFLSDVDLLAMPTTVRTAVTIESVTSQDPTMRYTQMTAPFDLTGQPAISVPCGLSDAGLPVGLQFVGRRFDETTVLRAAHAFESVAPMAHPQVE